MIGIWNKFFDEILFADFRLLCDFYYYCYYSVLKLIILIFNAKLYCFPLEFSTYFDIFKLYFVHYEFSDKNE